MDNWMPTEQSLIHAYPPLGSRRHGVANGHAYIEPPPGGYMFHISQMFFPRFFRKSYWRGANKIPGVHEPRRGLTFTILYYFTLKMSRHSNLEEIFFQWPC